MKDSQVFLIETTANLTQKEQPNGLHNHIIHPHHYRFNFYHHWHGDGHPVGYIALKSIKMDKCQAV